MLVVFVWAWGLMRSCVLVVNHCVVLYGAFSFVLLVCVLCLRVLCVPLLYSLCVCCVSLFICSCDANLIIVCMCMVGLCAVL